MLEIEIVPALSDNYVYLLHDTATQETAVIDPGEAPPVLAALKRKGWRPTSVINTHHHADHIAGNAEIMETFGAPLTAPAADAHRIEGIGTAVREGDSVRVGQHVARVIDTPGHTVGHIALWFEEANALFAGDTLFVLGCGRMFEGTPQQFWSSLSKLRALPDSTRLYCGHEYTQSNARFAVAVDAGNAALKSRAEEIDARRAAGQITIPSLLGDEKALNPFLRADDASLQAALGMEGADPVEVFAEIRKRKDNF